MSVKYRQHARRTPCCSSHSNPGRKSVPPRPLHAANLPAPGESFTTDTAIADEKETIALMHEGQGRGAMPMRGRAVDKALRNGPLTVGQKAAVKMILSDEDRVVGVQGYAGTGKTRMLNRTRALLEKRGFRVKGLAPSASAAQTLAAESGNGHDSPQARARSIYLNTVGWLRPLLCAI